MVIDYSRHFCTFTQYQQSPPRTQLTSIFIDDYERRPIPNSLDSETVTYVIVVRYGLVLFFSNRPV